MNKIYEQNQKAMEIAFADETNLFNSNTLSYFQQRSGIENKFIDIKDNGQEVGYDLEFQLVLFEWLSWPGVGVLGCPFKVGTFFTNKMKSGKTGVWLCVAENHDRHKESGQILAYFVGYKNPPMMFYNGFHIALLIGNYKKLKIYNQIDKSENYSEM